MHSKNFKSFIKACLRLYSDSAPKPSKKSNMPRPSANQAFSGNSLTSEKSFHESYGTLPGHIFSSPMAGRLLHQPVNIGLGDLISKRRR